MKNAGIFITIVVMLFGNSTTAQESTMETTNVKTIVEAEELFPLNGFQIHNKGLDYSKVEIKLDDATWVSNKLPVETEFKVKLLKPVGFVEIDGEVHFGMQLFISSLKGDTLGFMEDMYAGSGIEYTSAEYLSSLTLTLSCNALTPVGDTLFLSARFFDYNSDGFILVTNNLIIADPNLPLDVTYSTYSSNDYTTQCFASASDISFNGFGYVEKSEYPEDYIIFKGIEDMGLLKYYRCQVTYYYKNGKTSQESFSLGDTSIVKIIEKEENIYDLIIKDKKGYSNSDLKYLRFRIEKTHNQVLDGIVYNLN